MTQPVAHPLWRAAPRRLWRTPGWLGLVLVAATVLVASVVAPAVFVATARSTALHSGLGAVAGNDYGDSSGDLRVTWDSSLPAVSQAGVLTRLSALPSYGEPALGGTGVGQNRNKRAVAAVGSQMAPSSLWFHDGAIEALGGDPDGDGVWLDATVADELGLKTGDPVGLGFAGNVAPTKRDLTQTVLAGTYETAPGSRLPTSVAALPGAARWFLPADPDNPGEGSPLAVVGEETFKRLVLAVGETPLFTADLDLDPAITPDAAGIAVDEVQRFGKDAFDDTSELSGQLAGGDPVGARLGVATGLPDIVFEADGTADAARLQVRPYAVGGLLLGAGLLVGVWVLLGRGRQREQELISGLGLRPAKVAVLAALEVLALSVLAAPAGLALAWLGVRTAGPETSGGVILTTSDVVSAAVGAVAVVLLVAGTALVSAVAMDRQARVSRLGGGRRRLPWSAFVLVATALVAAAVFTVDVADRAQTPLVMLLPLLVATSAALVVVRAVGAFTARVPAGRPGSPRWLASRRTGSLGREVLALTAMIAVALGMFAYTMTVRLGIDEGVDDKTAVLAGARTTVEVADDFRQGGMDRAVSPPVDGSTIVWRQGASLPPKFGDQPLMAVDTETFGDVADWGASGDLDAGRAALPRLDDPGKGPVPVILAGSTDRDVGDRGTLDFNEEFTVPFVVVAVVDAFPGSETTPGDVTLVVSTRELFPNLFPTVDPRRKGATSTAAGAFSSWVWSGDSLAGLRADLSAAGIADDGSVVLAEQQRVSNGLVAATWAAGYVLALGAVVLALSLAAALVLALRLADRDTTSDVLLQRMRYPARALAASRAWEVGYAVLAAALAAASAVLVLVLLPTTIDNQATIAPLARPRVGTVDLAVFMVVLLAMVVLCWLIGARRARHRHAAEVLRAGG